MSKMVEQVAFALYCSDKVLPLALYSTMEESWAHEFSERIERYRALARAAITAMRNIPDDVLIRGWVDRFPDVGAFTVDRMHENWRGVVDEVLK